MSQYIVSLIKLHPEADDAAIVGLYNAASFAAVTANRVRAWLAETGLRERLERWLALTQPAVEAIDLAAPTAEQQQLLGLRSAIRQVLSAGDSDTLDLAPGSDHRQLLAAAVALQAVPFVQDDADRLIARALTRALIDEADVVAARAKLARREAVNARRAELSAWLDEQMSVLDAAADDESIELPEVPG